MKGISDRLRGGLLHLEDHRVRNHHRRVERQLRRFTPDSLSPLQRANRALALDTYHDYWRAGRVPRNRRGRRPSPVFVDASTGAVCAVGHLLDRGGESAAVTDIAASQNRAWVAEIDHPAVGPWAQRHGLSRDELALIQVPYTVMPQEVLPAAGWWAASAVSVGWFVVSLVAGWSRTNVNLAQARWHRRQRRAALLLGSVALMALALVVDPYRFGASSESGWRLSENADACEVGVEQSCSWRGEAQIALMVLSGIALVAPIAGIAVARRRQRVPVTAPEHEPPIPSPQAWVVPQSPPVRGPATWPWRAPPALIGLALGVDPPGPVAGSFSP